MSKNFRLNIKEEELAGIKFCSGATVRQMSGVTFYDPAGAIAKINGFDMEPEDNPDKNPKVINFIKTLCAVHSAKHNEDLAGSFDAWVKMGKSAISWFREKGYISE